MPATVVGAAAATDDDDVQTHAPDRQWSKSQPYEQRPSRLPVMPLAVVPPVCESVSFSLPNDSSSLVLGNARECKTRRRKEKKNEGNIGRNA